MRGRLIPALLVLSLSVPALAGLPPGLDFDAYKAEIGQRESGNRYDIANPYGYLGRYQMGNVALVDAGYKRRNPNGTYSWTGKDGITSNEAFLGSPAVQDQAFQTYTGRQWDYLRHNGLAGQVGRTLPDGTAITEAGLLRGSHLVGAGGLNSCMASGGSASSCRDANGTHAFDYVSGHKGGGGRGPGSAPESGGGDAGLVCRLPEGGAP